MAILNKNMKLSRQEFKNITTTKKTDCGLKFETITSNCTYGQHLNNVLKHNKDYSIDDYVDFYYNIYLNEY